MGHSECHSLIPDRVRQFSMSENGLVATGDYCSFAYSAFARFEKWLISRGTRSQNCREYSEPNWFGAFPRWTINPGSCRLVLIEPILSRLDSS